MFLSEQVHPSWTHIINDEFLLELHKIESLIGDNFNPSNPKDVLRFLSVDLNKVKIIWLGQDVYPMEGVATGRSFEVGGLKEWTNSFRQVSLKNIIRVIHKAHYRITSYKDIKLFSEIQKEITDGTFPILKPNEWFDSLETQGVLFLNTSFTCEIGIPNSHKLLWENFSRIVLNYVSNNSPNVVWFLWGKEAVTQKQNIHKGIFYESRHPMMCSEKYMDDFLKFSGFYETKHIINWLG